MADFFSNVEWEAACSLEALARLSLELREARAGVLRYYGIGHEDQLLVRVRDGECAEHPAYEHVLAMRILAGARDQVRQLIAEQGRGVHDAMTRHQLLQRHVDAAWGDLLACPTRLTLDALALPLGNGLVVDIRYASEDAYSLRWRNEIGREAGIDTSPVVHGLAAINHLHCADGRVLADEVTRVGAVPSTNLDALLRKLADNPCFALED